MATVSHITLQKAREQGLLCLVGTCLLDSKANCGFSGLPRFALYLDASMHAKYATFSSLSCGCLHTSARGTACASHPSHWHDTLLQWNHAAAPQAKEIMYHKANLNRIMADYTSQPLSKIEEDTDRDRYMSPLEAKEYGIIDHIIGGEEAVFNVKGSLKKFPKVRCGPCCGTLNTLRKEGVGVHRGGVIA